MIFTYLKDLENQHEIYPTFGKTTEIISDTYGADYDIIKQLLAGLIGDGYIAQLTKDIRYRQQIRILEPNWALIEKDGLWIKDSFF